jgi:two-component system, NtrC family, nitrogen regulation sensor histidine kinase NtrY
MIGSETHISEKLASKPLSHARFDQRMIEAIRQRRWQSAIGLMLLAWLTVSMLVSYWVLTGGKPGQQLLTPPLVALMLVINLIPALALLVLIGRRLARNRARQSDVGGSGNLHVRMVSLFSIIAAIPVLLLVIFASLLFQYGFDFWYSQKARGIFENANNLAQTYYREKQQTIMNETEVMAGDLDYNLNLAPISDARFTSSFGFQVYQRNLSEGAILRITAKNGVQSLAIANNNPYNRPAGDSWVPADVVKTLLAQRETVFKDAGNRMEAVTPIPNRPDLFLYVSRIDDSAALAQTKRFSLVLKDYNSLLDRSRSLQLVFHAALFLITLLVVGAAVAIALNVADRFIKPIGELVDAAQRVSGGDLSVRVTDTQVRDEIGILSSAFNQMTGRLEEQRHELVDANALLERRRVLIEAVLSSVTAGIIAVTRDRSVRLLNDSAAHLLAVGRDQATGQSLLSIAPELDALLLADARESIIDVMASGERRTLAVKIVADEAGHVLTFDDITQQLADQRSAAWSDVARRVAHEIKNPLTPIQLAAERLRRRFSRGEAIDPATAERLTDTIIRQVGDLRRMVDEFSSFARMPKPIFQSESLIDIVRQSLFLQQVAHPDIDFEFEAPHTLPELVCDRRQLGQAFTNIFKNGLEAIEQKVAETGPAAHEIRVEICEAESNAIVVTVSDTGIGLPAERERILEPYMTTRKSGTGLGLPIVKKITEEHGGTIGFSDREGGGTVVTLTFHPATAEELALLGSRAGGNVIEAPETAPRSLTRLESQ